MDEDPYRFDDEDEQAETEKALQEERDEIDAAASEVFEFDDSHAAERKELGFDLTWWKDVSFFDAHVAIGNMFDEVLASVDQAKALREEGLSESFMRLDVTLDSVTGPLFLAALQVLGIYLPEYRPEILSLLKQVPPKIEPSDEEKAQLFEAMERLGQKVQSEFQESMREAGFFPLEVERDDGEDGYAAPEDGEDLDAETHLGLGPN